jgi:hypothetical protein
MRAVRQFGQVMGKMWGTGLANARKNAPGSRCQGVSIGEVGGAGQEEVAA